MGHTVLVGRLVLGHTARRAVWWVGSTGHYEDNTVWCVSRLIGSDHTRIKGTSFNCSSSVAPFTRLRQVVGARHLDGGGTQPSCSNQLNR
jgi:hypothetical protein